MQTISFLLFRLQPPEPAVRIADIRRSSAGYTADIHDVTDGVCKLRKTYVSIIIAKKLGMLHKK